MNEIEKVIEFLANLKNDIGRKAITLFKAHQEFTNDPGNQFGDSARGDIVMNLGIAIKILESKNAPRKIAIPDSAKEPMGQYLYDKLRAMGVDKNGKVYDKDGKELW